MKKLILTIFITLFSILASLGQNIAELKQKAEQGDANAQCYLGYCYLNGKDVEKDPREAVKWFRKSAEQGLKEAQGYLGYCYFKGDGVEKDLREAVKWYRKSAEQGDALAQFVLPLMKRIWMFQNGVPRLMKRWKLPASFRSGFMKNVR